MENHLLNFIQIVTFVILVFMATINRTVFRAIVVGLLLLVATKVVEARHPVDWVHTNKQAYKWCLDPGKFTAFDRINPAIYSVICSFIASYGDRFTYVHHSDYRPEYLFFLIEDEPRSARSQHHGGNALDMRLKTYQGMSQCERYLSFKIWYPLLIQHLVEVGMFDRAGVGIYPDQRNPFFHLDFRGTRASWSRINGKYTSFKAGFDWLEEKLEECEK